MRMTGEFGYEKAVVAVALLILYAASGGIPAWTLAGAVAVLLAVLCAVETIRDHPGRARFASQAPREA
jgi:hypothetical protein